ncbi:MAG: GyrI-like domain-containing protein [Deltaproteobacteria bacterium]|nr:GyrI-like domain-containing protein [Deltaproteobacteria bacterium]
MSDVKVVNSDSFHSLVISDVVGTFKLGKVMGPAYTDLMAQIEKQGVELTDASIPFTIYRKIDWDSFDKKGVISMIKMMFFKKWHIDMGIPVPKSLEDTDKIKNMEVPGGKFLETIHTGPYHKVAKTYDKIKEYADSSGHQLQDYTIEFYLNDPREVKPQEIKTKVQVPIK